MKHTTWNALTHSGTITAKSRQSGAHRTFCISKTRPLDDDFMPGRRLVGLLIGPNNQSDYQNFGHIENGRIVLWRRYHGQALYEWAVRFLVDPNAFTDQTEFLVEGRCRMCGRRLTTPESVETGIGPVCGGRVS